MFKKEKQPREYRGVIDEIRQQQMKTKDMSFKGKLSYFWYYYKVHVLVTIIVIVAGGSWIHDIVTSKDYNFYGMMMNSAHLDGDLLENAFGEYAQLDMENYQCFIDTFSDLSYQGQSEYDMATFQRVVALVQTGDLDVMVLDAQLFYNFSFNSMMMDLRNIFTEEELARYEGKIYYIDYAKVRRAVEAENNGEDVTNDYPALDEATPEVIAAEAETHRNAASMAEPIPVGIFVDDSPLVQKTDCYGQSVPIYGVVATGHRPDEAKKYLEFMWDEKLPFETMIMTY